MAGPYFNFSLPEPTGVVAVIAPQASSLLGFVSVVAPAVVSGNTVVAVASERYPLPAVSLSEVLATSDVPGGVINVLTGRTAEIAPWLASHMDVNAIDLCGASPSLAEDLAVAAAENLKRVVRAGEDDWTLTPACSACSPTWRPRPSGTRPPPDRQSRCRCHDGELVVSMEHGER